MRKCREEIEREREKVVLVRVIYSVIVLFGKLGRRLREREFVGSVINSVIVLGGKVGRRLGERERESDCRESDK